MGLLGSLRPITKVAAAIAVLAFLWIVIAWAMGERFLVLEEGRSLAAVTNTQCVLEATPPDFLFTKLEKSLASRSKYLVTIRTCGSCIQLTTWSAAPPFQLESSLYGRNSINFSLSGSDISVADPRSGCGGAGSKPPPFVLSADGGEIFWASDQGLFSSGLTELSAQSRVNGEKLMVENKGSIRDLKFGSADVLHLMHAGGYVDSWQRSTGQLVSQSLVIKDGVSSHLWGANGSTLGYATEEGGGINFFEIQSGTSTGRPRIMTTAFLQDEAEVGLAPVAVSAYFLESPQVGVIGGSDGSVNICQLVRLPEQLGMPRNAKIDVVGYTKLSDTVRAIVRGPSRSLLIGGDFPGLAWFFYEEAESGYDPNLLGAESGISALVSNGRSIAYLNKSGTQAFMAKVVSRRDWAGKTEVFFFVAGLASIVALLWSVISSRKTSDSA